MSKLICKVRLDHNICCGCLDNQIDDNNFKSCEGCELREQDYEIIKVGHSLFVGDWAMVLCPNGTIKRVPLDRVYDAKHVEKLPPVSETVMKLDRLIFNLHLLIDLFNSIDFSLYFLNTSFILEVTIFVDSL